MIQDTVFWLRAGQGFATAIAACTKDLDLVSTRAQIEMLLRGVEADSIYQNRSGECWTDLTLQAENVVAKRSGLPALVAVPKNGTGVVEPVLSRLAEETARALSRRFGEMLDSAVRGLVDYRVFPSVLEVAQSIALSAVTARNTPLRELCGLMQRGCEITRGMLDPTHSQESRAMNNLCVRFDRMAEGNYTQKDAILETERLFYDLTRRTVSGEILGASPILCDVFTRIARRAKRI